MQKLGVIATTMIVAGLLGACGRDPIECKDTKHKTTVQFEMKSKQEVGKENPEIDAAKAQARSKWETEVKEKFGPEWASWSKSRNQGYSCSAPPGSQNWICEAEAPPCRDRKS